MRSAECKVACKHEGYQTGNYLVDKCYCMDAFAYRTIVKERKIKLPLRIRSQSVPLTLHHEPPTITIDYED